MKLLSDWGFRSNWQAGERGEYWVIAQALLLLGLILMPTYHLSVAIAPPWNLVLWVSAGLLGLFALVLFFGGLLQLGTSLTPLPYPREEGQLVQTGVYGLVRHPVYSGLVLGILAWGLFFLSVSHAIAALVFLVFFNAKASREEVWLTEKYPDYPEYRERVKKLIPWVY